MNKVSVVVPVYNEAPAIAELLRRVCEAELPPGFAKEVVVIDDGSTDNSMRSVRQFIEANPRWAEVVKLHESHINHGKGAAVRAGFKVASGNILIVQDADLEYDPAEFGDMLPPILDDKADVANKCLAENGVDRLEWRFVAVADDRHFHGDPDEQPNPDDESQKRCYRVAGPGENGGEERPQSDDAEQDQPRHEVGVEG